jgi:DegV family protein with EDD domain
MATQSSIQTINGKNLYYSFIAGSGKIFENQTLMNKINVFPVPDGDTGTNLATTFRYILDHIKPDPSFTRVARSIANAALEGSRGNSGIIVAEFLTGFSKKLPDKPFIDVEKFAQILNNAVDQVYQAIENPIEGTIITVLREWTEYINLKKRKISDFFFLLQDSLKAAQKSLAKTQEQLEVLRKNKVVDAGAQGIVYFLEGISDFLKEGNLKKILTLKAKKIEKSPELLHLDQFNYKYCTETIIEGEQLDKNFIKNKICHLGDSLVIAGSEKKVRVHIHTNSPAVFFHNLKNIGTLRWQKADNMAWQFQVAHNRKSDIALVTDSVCDLPPEILEKYQIYFLPISIFFGENHYLDKVTITPENFYNLLGESSDFPTTSQPNIKEFTDLYSFLSDHYSSIIAVHLSKELSGTWESSKSAAENVEKQSGKKITVLNSRHLSGSLGLIVYRIAEAIKKGLPHQQIVDQIENWINNSHILVSVKNLDTMVRGGRVSPMKGKIANLLNLKPIISLDENGKSILSEKAFSQKGNTKKVIRKISRMTKNKKIWKYSILHAHDIRSAEKYADQIKDTLGIPPEFIIDISPVVGLSAGLGALAVSLMFE